MRETLPKNKWLLFVAILVFLMSSLGSPANADQKIVNVCIHKKTGYVRESSIATCHKTELAVGANKLEPGNVRPKQMNSFFANRIKIAQLMGRKEGHNLTITSGWRSVEYQEMLFKNAVINNGSVAEASKWVLPPEYSMHPWGLAVDINYKTGKQAGAQWLETNGYKFGLCRRYKNEWWHFEPLVAPGERCPALEEYPVAK